MENMKDNLGTVKDYMSIYRYTYIDTFCNSCQISCTYNYIVKYIYIIKVKYIHIAKHIYIYVLELTRILERMKE